MNHKVSLLFFLRAKTIVSMLLFSLTNLYSQNVRVLTYEEAISIALKESFTIKSYVNTNLSMQYNYFYNKAMFKPRLDITIFSPNWNENVITIQQTNGLPVFNSYGSMQFGGDLRFTYTLPTGGNLALHSLIYRENLTTVLADQNFNKLTRNQAFNMLEATFNQPIFTKNTLSENLKEAQYKYQQALSFYTRGQIEIIYNVANGFYCLYRATKIAEISDEKLKNSEEAYRIVKLKSESGRLPEADVLTMEVKVAQNKAELSESINKLEREKDLFKQLIGLDLKEEIRITTDLKYDTFKINLDTALNKALKYRLEISENEFDIKLQSIQVDRAKRERELKGNISAYYDLTGISSIDSHNNSELFQSSYNNLYQRPPNRGITFTLSYPIYDWGRGSSKVKREAVTLKEKELQVENTKTDIVRQVRDIVRTVEEAKIRLHINKKNQALAIRSHNINRMRFENGDITNQQLSIEQQTLSDVQLSFLDSFITYQLAIADLKRKSLWDFQNNRTYIIDNN